jgi:phytoene synthase
LKQSDHAEELRRIAKRGDPDRYASALFAPSNVRPYLFALIAFNVELARVAQVSEPQLGEIRLQWWRDALPRAMAGESIGHPVVDAVGRAASARALSKHLLDALIDARQFDVSVKIMPNMAALETYLDATAGGLFRLGVELFEGRMDEATSSAGRSAGLAYGLTGLMRALPLHVRRGRIDLPGDLLRKHGVPFGDLLAGRNSEGLTSVLAELRDTARGALDEASRRIAGLPKSSRAAFRPLSLVEPYLSRLERADPFGPVVELNPLHRLLRLQNWRPAR